MTSSLWLKMYMASGLPPSRTDSTTVETSRNVITGITGPSTPRGW